MRAYIYDYVGNLTDAYHSGGGLLVVTDGDPLEAFIASGEALDDFTELPEPDRVIEVAPTEAPGVFIFPDNGCC